jgi:type IV pilus assembly protein PilQ
VSPILRITPLMVKTKKGTDTKIRIATRVSAPFEFRHEGDMYYIDFKHPEGLSSDSLLIEAAAPKYKVTPQKPVQVREDDISSDLTPTIVETSGKRVYKGRKVTLEFADAEVRKIFQLLSEVSNKNFVLSDEVTGAISLKLVNVPWDQALDIILDTKGLDKREDGNIILIKGKGKFRTQAEEDLDLKKTQLKNEALYTEYFPVNYSKSGDMKAAIEGLITANTGKVSVDERTNTLIISAIRSDIDRIKTYLAKMDVPERQVMIEARIVEASSTFTRNLGVSWGTHYRDGSASFLGINQMDNSFGGLTNPAVTSGQSGSAGTNMGISFGRLASNIQLDMRLNAAATAGLIKIVSTPKIATLNNKTAKITQGQSIPYQNTTSTTGATTQFVQAVLSLEVKPHINANGTIGMEIKATNNSPGTGSPPPINTKEATTEMLLKDGETTVIGGIYKEDDTQSEEGVPFLMDIPFLGRLFKSTSTVKTKSELLIFITPRILN